MTLTLKGWLQGWLLRLWANRPQSLDAVAATPVVDAGPSRARRLVPREYLSLHEYLDRRFANTVVLTFGQIEDLLGFALPDPARHCQDWWSNAEAPGPASPQSRSWTEACRLATANLSAQIVAFERMPA